MIMEVKLTDMCLKSEQAFPTIGQIKIETQLVVHDERKISPFVKDDNVAVPKSMLVEKGPQIVADQ